MAGRSVWPVTAAGVEGAVVESLSDLRGCYEGWLLEDPDLAGRIVVELAIADQDGLGQVVEAVVTESSAGHEVFEACVTSVLGELAFDSPGNGTLVVSYPFLFARDGD